MEGNTLNDSPSGTLDHSPCGTHIPVKEINTLVCLPMHKTWRSPQCEGFSDMYTHQRVLTVPPYNGNTNTSVTHNGPTIYSHVMSQPTYEGIRPCDAKTNH